MPISVAMLNRISWEKLVMKNRVKRNVMVVRLFNKKFQYNITPLIICVKKEEGTDPIKSPGQLLPRKERNLFHQLQFLNNISAATQFINTP